LLPALLQLARLAAKWGEDHSVRQQRWRRVACPLFAMRSRERLFATAMLFRQRVVARRGLVWKVRRDCVPGFSMV
jgi:hypothetical protein